MKKIAALAMGLLLALALAGPAPAQEDPGFKNALAAFEKFATWWVRELDAQRLDSRDAIKPTPEPGGGFTARYTAIDPASMALKVLPTGSPSAPYVGVLSYTETTCSHTGDTKKKALSGPFDKTSVRRVTEVFTHTKGNWH